MKLASIVNFKSFVLCTACKIMRGLCLLSGQGPLELLLRDPQAVLFYKYDRALNNISKLEERVTTLKANMREKISTSVRHCALSSRSRKRPASQTTITEHAPQAKTPLLSHKQQDLSPS